MESATFDLYRDIAERTDGDVYLGVVGPVRTGKSTFITRLMELLVMPKIPEGARKERIADELPQSGSGRTIMTTQPQFVPSEAVTVSLSDNAPVRVRLVDSVGYMVRGALGSVDKTGSRMVHTPWYDHDIPFEQAAEVGTRKVMTDHATIGVVVTTDGTIASCRAAPTSRRRTASSASWKRWASRSSSSSIPLCRTAPMRRRCVLICRRRMACRSC